MLTLTKNEIIIPREPPFLTIIVGPCRVGTTALANVFSKAGIITYLQPIKSARRALEAGETPTLFNMSKGKLAVIKETIGAKTAAEYFNPIEILLKLGYPIDKIQLISIVRDPRKTLASWNMMWKDVDLIKFVEAFKLTDAIKEYAKNFGIKTVSFVHEATRDNPTVLVIKNLFRALNSELSVTTDVLDWRNTPQFGKGYSKTNKIKFFDVPPQRFVKEVKEWGKYQFREEPELVLSDADQSFISSQKVLCKIYEEFLAECQKDLELEIKSPKAFNY